MFFSNAIISVRNPLFFEGNGCQARTRWKERREALWLICPKNYRKEP